MAQTADSRPIPTEHLGLRSLAGDTLAATHEPAANHPPVVDVANTDLTYPI